jgi:ABC-type nitrate/sulfonate/bicarbonate transport system permease component
VRDGGAPERPAEDGVDTRSDPAFDTSRRSPVQSAHFTPNLHRETLESRDVAASSFFLSVPQLMEQGLRGPALPRRRAWRLRLAALAGFIAIWSGAAGLVVALDLFNPLFLPGPWLVVGEVVELAMKGALWTHVAATLERVAIGFGIGAVAAIALGLPAGYFGSVRSLVEPVVELLRPIPPLAMLPLFIVWIGIGEGSKIGFITYATFFPMFLTTVHAVRQIDPLLVRAAQSLGARPAQLFARVILPAALPEMLTGIRLGVALSFFVIVISEFIGAEDGLGYLINDGRNFFLVPQMLGAAVLLGLLGYAGNAVVRFLERWLTRWQSPGEAAA